MRHLLLGLLLCTLPLFADTFDVDLLEKVGDLSDEAGKLDYVGKTAKAERIHNQAIELLDQYLKEDTVYSLPEKCAFTYRARHLKFRCKALRFVDFWFHENDLEMVEQIQDCDTLCVGEFKVERDFGTGLAGDEKRTHWVIRNISKQEKVMLKVKFLNVTKIHLKSGNKPNKK